MIKKTDLIVLLDDIKKHDENEVGVEAAKFAEIAGLGIPIPKGFVVTSNAYRLFLSANREIPEIVVNKVFRAYKNLDNPLRDANVDIGSSFSKKKFRNVKGEANVLQKIISFWNMYFDGSGIDYSNFEPAILVNKIPESIQPGTLFTIDPIRNDKRIIVINEGSVSPNQYEVSKHDFRIINKVIKKGSFQKLADNEIIKLAMWGKKLQDHYYFPQEAEFAIENSHKIYVTKIKPLTASESPVLQAYIPKNPDNIRRILASGRPIHPGITTGHLRIISRPNDLHKLRSGDVAVITNMKNMNFQDVARKAKAIVLESQPHRLLSHLFPRAFGKPMIITMPKSSKNLREGMVATVNASKGQVYI